MREECGAIVAPEDLRKVGTIDFEFVGDPVILEVHVFLTDKFSGMSVLHAGHIYSEGMLSQSGRAIVSNLLWLNFNSSGLFSHKDRDFHRLMRAQMHLTATSLQAFQYWVLLKNVGPNKV